MEVRRQTRNRLRRFSRGRQNFGIVLADYQGVLHVLHLDVAEEEVANIVAAVAIGLYADAIVRALEMNALSADILYASGDLAADGETVPVQKGAVGNGNVAARIVGSRRGDRPRLDGNIVVSHVGIDMIDDDMRRREGIDGVGIRRVDRRQYPDIPDDHVVRIVGNQLPHGRVLNGHALHAHMLAVVEDDHLRPGVAGAKNAVILDASRLLPPALARTVDDAFTGDGEIRGVGCHYQRLQIGQVKHGQGRIVRVIGGTEQRSALVELQGDVALEHDGSAEISAGDEPDRAASSLLTGIDSRLNRSRILRNTVAFGAMRTWIAGGG